MAAFTCKTSVATVGYQDCNTESTKVSSIPAGTVLTIIETTEAWYKTSSSGWIYIYNGTDVIVSTVTSGSTDLSTNSKIKINQNENIKDIYGNPIVVPINDNTFTVVEVVNDQVCIKASTGTTYWVDKNLVSVQADGVIIVPNNVAILTTKNDASITAENTILLANYAVDDTENNEWDKMAISTLRGIFGMPYQYMPIADMRLDNGNDFGYKYSEKIVSRIPLLVMVPGTPQFLAGYSKEYKERMLNEIKKDFNMSENSAAINTLIQNPGKYYSLNINWQEYFNAVNPMCRAAAKFLNIENYKYLGVKFEDFNWLDNQNEDLKKKLNYKGGVAFYINSETQISDNFTNSTGPSGIASKINDLSNMGRELNFILGASGAIAGGNDGNDDGQKNKNTTGLLANGVDALGAGAQKLLPGGDLIKAISNGISTVIQGGRLIFPEIWNDSSFSRDYDIDIKLVSPECDPVSLYLNIIVPLLHLVGFVAPRSTGPNGYNSPFLVRAFYKGMFNCDMGIVSSMSISKGGEGDWSPYGVPTVVDVHFTIKELYGTMAITDNDKDIEKGLMNNIVLLDYIANMCGVNINEPDFRRILYLYYTQNFKNRIKDKVYMNTWVAVDQWFTNARYNIYDRLKNK